MSQARMRITFAKGPRLKYISHLDLALTWERALRRAEVPLAYSQGSEEFITKVGPTLPEGLSIASSEEVQLKAPSLQSALRQAVYRVSVETSLTEEELSRRVANLLASDVLEQQRIRKERVETFDLRPLVHDVRLEAISDGQATLSMRLSAGQHGNVRPDAVTAALGLENAFTQVERTRLLFEFDSP
jgi:radical SAM-linked protein